MKRPFVFYGSHKPDVRLASLLRACKAKDGGDPEITIADRAKLAADIEALMDERDDYRERLSDIATSLSEQRAIGGGPGWKGRWDKALDRACEVFEP